MQCLGEAGQQVMGMACTDFYHLSEDLEAVRELGMSLTWKPLKVVVRGKIDQGGYSQDENGGPNIRYSCVRVAEVPPRNESNMMLLNRLAQYKDHPDL